VATEYETKILEALLGRLATLTLSPVVPVAWPMVGYTPGASPYIRPWLLPGTTTQVELGSEGHNRHTGIFQVSLFWPESSAGIRRPMEAAGAIARHFRRGLDISSDGVVVRIFSPPYTSPLQQEPGWSQIPVNVPYQCDTPNPS
jgi:hypothetical protein